MEIWVWRRFKDPHCSNKLQLDLYIYFCFKVSFWNPDETTEREKLGIASVERPWCKNQCNRVEKIRSKVPCSSGQLLNGLLREVWNTWIDMVKYWGPASSVSELLLAICSILIFSPCETIAQVAHQVLFCFVFALAGCQQNVGKIFFSLQVSVGVGHLVEGSWDCTYFPDRPSLACELRGHFHSVSLWEKLHVEPQIKWTTIITTHTRDGADGVEVYNN